MGFVPKILESNNDDKTLKFVWNPVLKINALSVFLSFAIMFSKDSNSSLLPDKSLEPVEPIPYCCAAIIAAFKISELRLSPR